MMRSAKRKWLVKPRKDFPKSNKMIVEKPTVVEDNGENGETLK